tara:strand:+ start:210 stop:1145 length:936 start_codon:yes stop_codon:yes gene_type:complete
MKKLTLVGFNTDYGRLDVDRIRRDYNVDHISLPPLVISFLLRLNSLSSTLYLLVVRAVFDFYLRRISSESILITDDNVVSLAAHFSRRVSGHRKILIFRNIFNGNFDLSSLSNVEKYSFDKNDCVKYNLNLYNQYCSGFEYLLSNSTSNKKEFDFYFLGLNKNRKNILEKLQVVLTEFDTRIEVKEKATGFKKFSKFILRDKKYHHEPYITHLANILSCRVVIDILQKGQSGITMRTLEALISGKKIITNNYSIKYEPFYDSNKIMIIGNDFHHSKDEIRGFLEEVCDGYDNISLGDFDVRRVFNLIIEGS